MTFRTPSDRGRRHRTAAIVRLDQSDKSFHPPRRMFRDPVPLLPLALGPAAALVLLAVISPSPDFITVACNIGPADGAYERCLAELPARQAEADESARVRAELTGPIVAAAGGLLAAASSHPVLRRSRSLQWDDTRGH